MGSIKSKCKKCGSTYGYYATIDSARKNVSRHDCRKGAKCELEESNLT